MSHLDELDQLLARAAHDGDDALRDFALALAAETDRPAPVPSPRLAAFLDDPRLTPASAPKPARGGSRRPAPPSKRRPALGWLVRATLAALALVLAGTAAVAAVRHNDRPTTPQPAPPGPTVMPHHRAGPVRRDTPAPITPTSTPHVTSAGTTPSAPHVQAIPTNPAPKSTDSGHREGRPGQTSTGDPGQHDGSGDSPGDGSADTSGSDPGSSSAPTGSDDQSGLHGPDDPGTSSQSPTESGQGN